MWVLLKEVNVHDQYGEYFVAGFANKPTLEDLVGIGVDKEDAETIIKGDIAKRFPYDRIKLYIREMKDGEIYDDIGVYDC